MNYEYGEDLINNRGGLKMTEKTYKIKINHEELRREMDNYINHAEAKGFKLDGYAGLQGYCHLLDIVMRIEFEKQYTREVKND